VKSQKITMVSAVRKRQVRDARCAYRHAAGSARQAIYPYITGAARSRRAMQVAQVAGVQVQERQCAGARRRRRRRWYVGMAEGAVVPERKQAGIARVAGGMRRQAACRQARSAGGSPRQ